MNVSNDQSYEMFSDGMNVSCDESYLARKAKGVKIIEEVKRSVVF